MTTTTRRKVVPEDLRRFKICSDPVISPDGSTIVFVLSTLGNRNKASRSLWLMPADRGSARKFTSGHADGQPRFSPDGRSIGFIRTDDDGSQQVCLIPVDGGEARVLTSFAHGSISTFRFSPDGRSMAVKYRQADPDRTPEAAKERTRKKLSTPPLVIDDHWYRLDGDGYFGADRHKLYMVSLASGKHRLLFDKDRAGHFEFEFLPGSRQLVVSANLHERSTLASWETSLYRLDTGTGRLTEYKGLPKGPKLQIAPSPDGSMIAFAGRPGRSTAYSVENLELLIHDIKSGRTRSLTNKTDYCLMSITLSDTAEASFEPQIQWDPEGRHLLARIGWQGSGRVARIPVSGGPVRLLTDDSGECCLGGVDQSGKKVALVMSTPVSPPEIWLGRLDDEEMTLSRRTRFNDSFLKQLDLVEPSEHWIKSADGNKVHVWIMRPPGVRPSKRTPAVLEIHGGPHGQYGRSFFHEFQVLASAGYTVFYSNPRGSKGYGRDFCAAIKGSWGGADWRDIQAVTRFIGRHPGVRKDLVGIMGGSYGGYMTNWAIAHSNKYKAAITDRCVSNLVSMGGSSDWLDNPGDYWEGAGWDKPEDRWSQSPIAFFKGVKTPTLIIHSEGDLRCNIEQAEQVHAALVVQDVPTRFVRYPRESSHGMSRSGPADLRIHRLDQILQWWRRWLR